MSGAGGGGTTNEWTEAEVCGIIMSVMEEKAGSDKKKKHRRKVNTERERKSGRNDRRKCHELSMWVMLRVL